MDVPEDSADANKWPLWKPVDTTAVSPEQTTVASGSGSAPSTSHASAQQLSESADTSSSPTHTKPVKRPGPRKPKIKLTPLPQPEKAKKLTTLDMSAMHWKAHVSAAPDPALKDELEANRRGGGYLEKVEFLQRVDERKDQAFEAAKASKRRRG